MAKADRRAGSASVEEALPEELRAQWKTLMAGVETCEVEADLAERLRGGKPLRVKFGCDPTAPDIHLGHTVPLNKLRQFQSFGHTVVFLIGDWTARIGDPSNRSETRPPLSEEEVRANAQTYLDQVGKVLDMDRTEVRYNGEWLDRLTSREFVELASKYTVSRMLERADFKARHRQSGQADQPREREIHIHEFLYPLAQGYDSVVIQADVEIGGTDQTFNLFVARDIQRRYGQRPQVVMTLPILEGTDGVTKMSKSLGNHIGVSEPPREMFGKLMSISDELMWRFWELCLGLPAHELTRLHAAVDSGEKHPRALKAELARRIVARYHSDQAAREAADEFDRVFRDGQAPGEVEEVTLKAQGQTVEVLDLLVRGGLAATRSEAKRLVAQGGVSLNGEREDDPRREIPPGEYLVKVGKRRFLRVHVR